MGTKSVTGTSVAIIAPAKKLGNPDWQPGVSGNPSGRPKDVHEIRHLARSFSVEAINKLYSLMTTCDDERIQLRAAEVLLDRGCGHVQSQEQVERADASIPESIRNLSDAELVVIVQRRLNKQT